VGTVDEQTQLVAVGVIEPKFIAALKTALGVAGTATTA